MIKPIETLYKGYRFRSRLEARWAVFFDAMKIRYEYEPEGYILSDGSCYLPDFWLPDQKTFVEIKPFTRPYLKSLKIYLAGKIYKSEKNWRRHLFVDGDYTIDSTSAYKEFVKQYPPALFGGHQFVGPYAIDLGESGHYIDLNYADETEESKKEVYKLSMGQIEKADLIFVWIDSLDAYGTLVELGYAKACDKKILIGIDEKLEGFEEMWFALQSASKVIKSPNALLAYFDLVEDIDDEVENKCMYLSELQEVFLVKGSPGESDLVIDKFCDKRMIVRSGNFSLSPRNKLDVLFNDWRYSKGGDPEIVKAFQAARSARFEHGEKPEV